MPAQQHRPGKMGSCKRSGGGFAGGPMMSLPHHPVPSHCGATSLRPPQKLKIQGSHQNHKFNDENFCRLDEMHETNTPCANTVWQDVWRVQVLRTWFCSVMTQHIIKTTCIFIYSVMFSLSFQPDTCYKRKAAYELSQLHSLASPKEKLAACCSARNQWLDY